MTKKRVIRSSLKGSDARRGRKIRGTLTKKDRFRRAILRPPVESKTLEIKRLFVGGRNWRSRIGVVWKLERPSVE